MLNVIHWDIALPPNQVQTILSSVFSRPTRGVSRFSLLIILFDFLLNRLLQYFYFSFFSFILPPRGVSFKGFSLLLNLYIVHTFI